MHGKDREFSIQFNMKVRAAARREGRSLLLQPSLQFLARQELNVIVFGYNIKGSVTRYRYYFPFSLFRGGRWTKNASAAQINAVLGFKHARGASKSQLGDVVLVQALHQVGLRGGQRCLRSDQRQIVVDAGVDAVGFIA